MFFRQECVIARCATIPSRALRKPTPKQERRLAQLREELAPLEIPGATRRERRLLEIIDKELAQTEQEPDPKKRFAIKDATDALVADLNRLVAQGRSPA